MFRVGEGADGEELAWLVGPADAAAMRGEYFAPELSGAGFGDVDGQAAVAVLDIGADLGQHAGDELAGLVDPEEAFDGLDAVGKGLQSTHFGLIGSWPWPLRGLRRAGGRRRFRLVAEPVSLAVCCA